MKQTLLSKNKIKFNNGKITTPSEDDPLFDSWEHCNNIVLAWISSSFALDISQSMIYIENATQLLIDLANLFSNGDHFHISDLLQQVHSIHRQDCDNLL